MNIRSLKIKQQDNTKGHPFAPVQLIEYRDYECPYSRMGYRFVQMLLRKKEGQVYFSFRNFPLRKKHPHAQLCAEAVLAARKQGEFWRMHDLLFENNQHLSKQALLEFADQIGLNLAEFENDLEQRTFREQVTTELKEGISHGVDDTPTFFINENKYKGELGYKELQKSIDDIL